MMQKKLTLTVYRDWKETFNPEDLQKLAEELREALKLEVELDIVSKTDGDGEELMFIVGD